MKSEVCFNICNFVQIRKRDWHEQGSLLKTRINTKLSVYKAAVRLKIRSLSALDSDSRSVKRLVYEAVAILIDAAEACLLSGWRKMKTCEELFSSLLLGVAQIAIARGGQPLRILLIRLKPIVLNVCAQVHFGYLSILCFHCCFSIQTYIPIDIPFLDFFLSFSILKYYCNSPIHGVTPKGPCLRASQRSAVKLLNPAGLRNGPP